MTRTYGKIKRVGDVWVIERVEPHVALRLKQVFQGIHKAAKAPFTLKGGVALDADLHWFLTRYPMEIDADHRNLLNLGKAQFETNQVEFGRLLSDDWQAGEVDFKPGYQPYKFQAQAAEIAQRTGRLLLMDDVGLGKTVSAMAAICDKRFLPAAVVVQTHLAAQWQAEYIEPFTHLTSHIISGTRPYTLPVADVYIFKYSNIAGWVDYVADMPFKSVVFDEIQELRHGRKSQKGRAAEAFTAQARLRLGLTATPIYNYGSEIFNILNLIDPGCLGSYDSFIIEWCQSHGSHWVVSDPQALGTYMRENFLSLRRTEGDVGDEMPPVNTLVHDIGWDEKEAKKSDELARQLALKVQSGGFTERGQAARELDALARHQTGVAKARGVAEFVSILQQQQVPMILLGWHRDVYKIWLEEMAEFKPIMYTGSETTRKKDAAKSAFLAGESNLLVMSLRSGVGLDGLQHRASTVVFGELDWSPQVHRQIIGRLRRPGQARQVDAIYLNTHSGTDPLMMETLGLKASQSHGIVDPLKAAPTQHSDKTRLQRLAEQYLQQRGAAA